ncbi:MAG: prolyl oligopeptidase family serine peptidase, partial [Bacteroidota bacterium]
MKIIKFPILLMIAVLCACTQSANNNELALVYPETKKVDTVDTYFGTDVADPYRWLEDDNAEDTKSWVTRQNELTSSYLSQIDFRDDLKARLQQLEDYEKVGTPFKRGDYYYFYKNDGLQNQSVLYRTTDFNSSEVFLDPNTFSEDGTTALGGLSFSSDFKYAAFNTSEGGSDWRTAYVMDVISKEILEDTVKWLKFTGMSWYKNGFFYQGFEAPNSEDQLSGTNSFGKIYYHKVGEKQSMDELIYQNAENANNRFGASVSEDERFLFLYSTVGTSGNELYVKDLEAEQKDFIPIITGFDNNHYVVGSENDRLIIHTNLNAPKNRVVTVNVDNPSSNNWEDLISETEFVMNARTAGGYIFTSYLKDAKTEVKQYSFSGKLIREIELPGIGTASGFSAAAEDSELFYSFTSFTVPSSSYRFDIESGESTLHERPDIDFDPTLYETKQIFFNSKDGTRIPMFIVHKKGIKLNGKNPTWLYSYGGFNVSLRPSFRTSRLIWLENGGVFAMPNIRGGGEYGENWHKSGTKLLKKNVFNDFIAAAEYLIEEQYTSSEYLALQGGSNG